MKVLHSRPNQTSFTSSSLHFEFFFLHYYHWFYVTFLNSWLLKWFWRSMARAELQQWQGPELSFLWLRPLIFTLVRMGDACFPTCCHPSFSSSPVSSLWLKPFFVDFQAAFRSTELFLSSLSIPLTAHSPARSNWISIPLCSRQAGFLQASPLGLAHTGTAVSSPPWPGHMTRSGRRVLTHSHHGTASINH